MGMVAGVLVAVLLTFSESLFGVKGGISFLWVAWWSFVASLLGVLVGSFLAPPPHPGDLTGLMMGRPNEEPRKPSKEAAG